MIKYISDTHFSHANIIRYCARPFHDIHEMDKELETNLRACVNDGHKLVHCGDFGFGRDFVLKDFFVTHEPLLRPEDHILVCGNHDQIGPGRKGRLYGAWFGTIVGTYKTWTEHYIVVEDTLYERPVKIMCSHVPQQDLKGCDYNVYGHIHNDLEGFGCNTYPYLPNSTKHLNASAEVVFYKPRSIKELIDMWHTSTGIVSRKAV